MNGRSDPIEIPRIYDELTDEENEERPRIMKSKVNIATHLNRLSRHCLSLLAYHLSLNKQASNNNNNLFDNFRAISFLQCLLILYIGTVYIAELPVDVH